MSEMQKEGVGMSELVTLGKKVCGICGRKDCNNPGWPSWGCMECYRLGYEREKARAEVAEAERRKTALFYNCGGEPPCEKCVTCHWDDAREALAAARREVESLSLMVTDLRAALEEHGLGGCGPYLTPGDHANVCGTFGAGNCPMCAALTAPADGEEGQCSWSG